MARARPIYPRGYTHWLKAFSEDNPQLILVKIFNARQEAIHMAAKARGFKMMGKIGNYVRFEKMQFDSLTGRRIEDF
jgi:hypothetical protein